MSMMDTVGCIKYKLYMNETCVGEEKGESVQSYICEKSLRWGSAVICGPKIEKQDAGTLIRWDRSGLKTELLLTDAKIIPLRLSQNSILVDVHFFAVYDGHGGCEVANYCKEHLHVALVDEIDRNRHVQFDSEQWTKVFTSCFTKINDEVSGFQKVGSNALVVLVTPSDIITANCGSSRAVLMKGKDLYQLSTDHKPQRADERERIRNAGGVIFDWGKSLVYGMLASTRSIGDAYLEPFVISDPDVSVVPRTSVDKYLVIGNDALYDVFSNEDVIEAARRKIFVWNKVNKHNVVSYSFNESHPASQKAANFLAKAASKFTKDDIGVVVLNLKR